MNTSVKIVGLISLLSLVFASEAQAYFDPGTGSILLQGLAAGLVAFLAFWRTLRQKLKTLFFKKNKEVDEEQHE